MMVGDVSVGVTLVPIPNTTVKPHSADGTAGSPVGEYVVASLTPETPLSVTTARGFLVPLCRRPRRARSSGCCHASRTWHLRRMSGSAPSLPETRAGTVALVGRPNAGKSTLLNAFVGEKLSIVTPKAQTTWQRVTGIATSERTQMIFLDTPGLLEVRDLLQRTMLQEARQALQEADVVLFVMDATRPAAEIMTSVVREALAEVRAPLFAVLNKADVAAPDAVAALAEWADRELRARTFVVSATRGTGIEPLREAVEDVLPRSPFLYDPEDIASQPLRFFVSELVRETVFEQFSEEVPYSVVGVVDEFREADTPVYIRVTLFVERSSQKQILIGERGRAIRQLGTAARQKVEHLIGRPVYLDLWVKALPGWRRKRGHLARFGFRLPEDDERAR